MRLIARISLILMLWIFGNGNASAQMVVDHNIDDDSLLAKAPWADNIHIYSDPRLDLLVEKHKNLQTGGIVRMRGYRVQIYYGTDRQDAINRKVDFMRRYPKEKTYMTYIHPQYRVRVGNFASREDAVQLYRIAISLYGSAMMVPENVTVNTLEEHEY